MDEPGTRSTGRTGRGGREAAARWTRRVGVGLGAALLIAAAARYGDDAFRTSAALVPVLGAAAVPAFVALHALSVCLLVPSVLPAFAAGALFGAPLGLVASALGAALGATVAFLAGRHAGRARAERWLRERPRLRALERAVARGGFRLLLLARLTPVAPFAIGNYVLGLAPLRARGYFAAALIGTLPSNAVYAGAGALSGRLAAGAEAGSGAPGSAALLGVGLAATLLLALVVGRAVRRALAEAEAAPDAAEPGGSPRIVSRSRLP